MIITYIIIATIWAFYSVYKTSKMGNLGKLTSNQIKTFLINLILFPYCLFYAIMYKKF